MHHVAGAYVEKYVKLLTVTSIKAVKCILPLLFDSPSYTYIHLRILTQSKLSVMLLCINFIFNCISDLHTTHITSQAI